MKASPTTRTFGQSESSKSGRSHPIGGACTVPFTVSSPGMNDRTCRVFVFFESKHLSAKIAAEPETVLVSAMAIVFFPRTKQSLS